MIFRLSRQARQDLLQIRNYIAEDSEAAADRFIDFLIGRFQMLGASPGAGRRRDELRPGYRSFPAGQYVIFYRVEEYGVAIMHVLHGKRDIDGLMQGDL
ncbi:type II toxin-antitoxin system RelE/ParE family toxin [Paracidobacterium acidisoli]|uniref:Toxin n=1 Tax=Paracidobacterium acidisoli TaxID=2303751 RepID=A0A372IQ26_9BACT|nr:type II toxin-antitoxin system RelE/ParE family toxin [Paracidobacterium acidisoli]MBT9331423.1 type II toxin-antitoxin system RelE/ParE family toxin [Paracidobacterium acidisoli]